MRQKQNVELYICVFGILTFIFILLELLLVKQNDAKIKNVQAYPYLRAREMAILFNVSFSFIEGMRGIYRTNVGYLIVYYLLISFVIYRNVMQFRDFEVNAIYILQCTTLGITIMYYTYAAFNIFYISFWLTFRFLGVNKRIINAYIIRLSLKAFREAYFVYCLLVTFYLSCPTIFPGIEKEYKVWKLGYIPGFVFTSYKEDDENIYRKIADILLWFCVFLELLLNRVIRSIVKGTGNYAYDVYFTIILFSYTCLSTIDLTMYGSGLKDFLIKRNQPVDINIEN